LGRVDARRDWQEGKLQESQAGWPNLLPAWSAPAALAPEIHVTEEEAWLQPAAVPLVVLLLLALVPVLAGPLLEQAVERVAKGPRWRLWHPLLPLATTLPLLAASTPPLLQLLLLAEHCLLRA
jgi:hypothetical protein